MTFEEFKQVCNQAITTGQQQALAWPIVIGTGENRAYIGDTPNHHLIIFKTDAANAELRDIYRSVGFSFDAPNNQVVIKPITHG